MIFISFILFNLINFIIKYFVIANENIPYKYEIKPDILPQEIFNKTINKLYVCKQHLKYGNCTKKLIRYFWDNKSEKCFKFYYTGCGGNQNNFSNKRKCQKHCSPKNRKTKIIAKFSIKNRKKTKNRKKEFIEECKPGYAGSGLNCTNDQSICGQPFDYRYQQNKCVILNKNNWQARWYFNINSGHCLQFWHGGCQFANSQNFFLDQQSCETFCSGYLKQKQFLEGKENNKFNKVLNFQKIFSNCFEPFNHSLRRPCEIGIWKQRYFFDKNILSCRSFWMDFSCPYNKKEEKELIKNNNYYNNFKIKPKNLFLNLTTCQQICEGKEENYYKIINDDKYYYYQHHYDNHRHKLNDLIKFNFNKNTTKEKQIKKVKWKKEENCQKQKIIKEKIKKKDCYEDFDFNLTKNCGKFNWKIKYFFDKHFNLCRPFWHNKCFFGNNSNNYFETEKSCKQFCINNYENDNLIKQKDKFSYFGSGKEEEINKNKIIKYFPNKTKEYIKSKIIIMNETRCSIFNYKINKLENIKLKAFLCLIEEGGQCQLNILSINFKQQKCFIGKPWLLGKHSYIWFFGLNKKILNWNENNNKINISLNNNNNIFIELLDINNFKKYC